MKKLLLVIFFLINVVRLYGQCTLSVNLTSTDNVICSGAPVTLIATPSAGTPGYTYAWNTGETTSSITVNKAGTYTVSVKDNSASCPSVSKSIVITDGSTPPVPVVADVFSCPNAPATITASGSSGTYQWYDANGAIAGATSITLSNVSTGNYSLQVTDANGCVAGGAGSVTTFSVPASTAVHAQFNTNPSPAVGTVPLVVTFNNTSNGASSYIWSFGDAANTYTTSTNASYTYNSVGSYTATLVAINGACADTARVVILAEIPTTITVPNIFSPNGDGVNDQFFIINTGMKSMNCDIFNRWGQLLWTLTAPDQTWDGSLINGDKAPEGTYMYILEANGLDGKTYKQQGTVTLVR